MIEEMGKETRRGRWVKTNAKTKESQKERKGHGRRVEVGDFYRKPRGVEKGKAVYELYVKRATLGGRRSNKKRW